MKKIIISAALCSLFILCTGMSCRIDHAGLAFSTHSPIPTNVIIRAEVTSIGIMVDQNQATQTPETTVGYKRATLTIDPTAIGQPVFSAPLTADISVQAGFSPNIKESLSTVTNAVPK